MACTGLRSLPEAATVRRKTGRSLMRTSLQALRDGLLSTPQQPWAGLTVLKRCPPCRDFGLPGLEATNTEDHEAISAILAWHCFTIVPTRIRLAPRFPASFALRAP